MKRIVISKEGVKKKTVEVPVGLTRIGSSRLSEIELEGKSIQKHHCDIIRTYESVKLKDRSGKGVFVDGEKVKEATLYESSVIEIGKYKLVLIDFKDNSMNTLSFVRENTGKELANRSRANVLYIRSIEPKYDMLAEPVGHIHYIGSGVVNDTVVNDGYLSEKHSRCLLDNGQWFIEDLGSKNGTWVNYERINNKREIEPGMIIKMGNSIFEVLAGELDAKYPGAFGIISRDTAMVKVFITIRKAAPSNENVLLTGETGVGKKVVTQAIHQVSKRSIEKLITFDCSKAAPNLIDSELFGHKKGSFTGAKEDRIGFFEQADGGTILIDEIGELEPNLQKKLLRAVGEGEVIRIGENKPRKVDTRIISATNRPIIEMVNNGSFRRDLFYRLKGFMIHIPPLRERPADIPLLANYFLEKMKVGPVKKKLSSKAMQKLEEHDFPGNVRELEQIISMALTSCETEIIGPQHIDTTPVSIEDKAIEAAAHTPGKSMVDHMRKILLEALAKYNDNQTKTAKELGMSRKQLASMMKKCGIKGARSKK